VETKSCCILGPGPLLFASEKLLSAIENAAEDNWNEILHPAGALCNPAYESQQSDTPATADSDGFVMAETQQQRPWAAVLTSETCRQVLPIATSGEVKCAQADVVRLKIASQRVEAFRQQLRAWFVNKPPVHLLVGEKGQVVVERWAP
jgi:hypothetical protein